MKKIQIKEEDDCVEKHPVGGSACRYSECSQAAALPC